MKSYACIWRGVGSPDLAPVCRSAMMPAHMPRSRRRSKLTGFVRRRRTFQGPIDTATTVIKSAGYAVAMLNREIKSRRMENNSQNSAAHAKLASAINTCRMILWSSTKNDVPLSCSGKRL